MLGVTALVPMKGSSERVKGKNLRIFHNLPLCTYIMNTLQNSQLINTIIVNTDSQDIAETCSKYSKVIIHWRPHELRGHNIPMNAILEWDLLHDSQKAEHYLQTHATNPLLTSKTVDEAIKIYFNNLESFNSLFSVTLYQTRLYDEHGKGVNHNPEFLINTQNLPKLYEENSNIYIFSKTSFFDADKKRIGTKPYMFTMNKSEALDIDTEEDFLIAQATYNALWRI